MSKFLFAAVFFINKFIRNINVIQREINVIQNILVNMHQH